MAKKKAQPSGDVIAALLTLDGVQTASLTTLLGQWNGKVERQQEVVTDAQHKLNKLVTMRDLIEAVCDKRAGGPKKKSQQAGKKHRIGPIGRNSIALAQVKRWYIDARNKLAEDPTNEKLEHLVAERGEKLTQIGLNPEQVLNESTKKTKKK